MLKMPSADDVKTTMEHQLAKLGMPKGFIGAVKPQIDGKEMKVIFDEAVNLDAYYVTLYES